MNIKRFDGTTGTVIDLGRHHGRLRRDAGDLSVAFFFEFQKLQRVDAAQKEEASWDRLMINPYSDIPGKTPSEIVDVADEYMFKIRGYSKKITYEVWPKKIRADVDTLRPPYSEKKKWMVIFRKAFAELEEYSYGRGRGVQIPIKTEYMNYLIHAKKGKGGADDIDRRFVEFHGTIEKAIYAKKKSPKFGYDNRLLELLVEVQDGLTYAIIRYRNDEHSTEINGYLDLGADGNKDEAAWKESLEDLVPRKGNRPPTRTKMNSKVAKGKKGHVVPGKEGVLTLIMKDRRRGGKERKYEFKIPGGQAGAEFYERVLEYAEDWQVKKLLSKDAPAAFGYHGGPSPTQRTSSVVSLPSLLEIALREGDYKTAQTILSGLALPEESDPELFVPLSERGGGQALAACFPRNNEWGILHITMKDEFLNKLLKLTKEYIEEQIGLVRSDVAVVAKLRHEVASLSSSADSYRGALESMQKEAVFDGLMTLLDDLSARASARCATACGGPKPKHVRLGKELGSAATLKAIYRKARQTSTIFDDLLDALGEWKCCRENPIRADAKNPFRALETCGLDKKRLSTGWDFSTLTDIISGVITVENLEEAKQLVMVLMACDDREQENLTQKKGAALFDDDDFNIELANARKSKKDVRELQKVQDVRKAIGGSLNFVGVNNRLSTGSESGERRDVQLKFYFSSDKEKHICEIQIMHASLADVRAADVYDHARNAIELLEYTGHSDRYRDPLLDYTGDTVCIKANLPSISRPAHADGGQKKRKTTKFVARDNAIRLGTGAEAATGLPQLMGVDEATIGGYQIDQMDAIEREFVQNGNEEDKKNFATVLDGTYQNPPDEKTGELYDTPPKTIDELMLSPEVQKAKLGRHHVVALRLYTTSSYETINKPMRTDPPTQPNPFAATTFFISEGIKRLRAVDAHKPDRNEPMVYWRGLDGVALPQRFANEGGTEFGCMSTSTEKDVAIEFSEGKHPLVFKFVTDNFMSRGADISFLSVYPKEKETLYPPLTYLQVDHIGVEVINYTRVLVASVRPMI